MVRSTNTNITKTTGPSSLDLKAGQKLGKYRLSKYLGEGGSCEVWKARDTVESILGGLKIPLADVHGKRDNQALLREIRLVSQLSHPHIMPVKNADIPAWGMIEADVAFKKEHGINVNEKWHR